MRGNDRVALVLRTGAREVDTGNNEEAAEVSATRGPVEAQEVGAKRQATRVRLGLTIEALEASWPKQHASPHLLPPVSLLLHTIAAAIATAVAPSTSAP